MATVDEADMATTMASSEKDAAMAMVGEQRRAIDPAIEARVVRKIDMFLIPAMVIGYGLVYYDKAILGSAVLFGMTKDLDLFITNTTTSPPTVDTRRLSWATSLFYVGMLAGLYPMTFALQRFPTGRTLGVIVTTWAAACMLTAAVTSWRGLYAARFFLGVVESIIPTAFMCIVSSFYTQAEQSLRQSWWYSSNGSFVLVGGGLNYAFAHVTGALRPWQSIYLLAGALTLLFGCFCFAIPTSPLAAWFLTPDERATAVERLRRGQTGVRCAAFKPAQVREAAADVKVWLVAVMMATTYTMNGAVSGFGPLIVSTFGWSALQAVLLQLPLGAVCVVVVLATGYVGSRCPDTRIVMLVGCCLPVVAGCAIVWRSEWTQRAVAPVVGYTLTGFFGGTASLTISVGMSNVAGHTKKSFMAATTFVAYCVGNIVGPLLVWSETKEDHYPALWLGLIICHVICMLAAVALYVVLYRGNKMKMIVPQDETERARLAFRDLTDKENPYFRYVY